MAIPPDLFRGNVRFALQPGRRATSSSIPPDLFRGKVRFALQPGQEGLSTPPVSVVLTVPRNKFGGITESIGYVRLRFSRDSIFDDLLTRPCTPPAPALDVRCQVWVRVSPMGRGREPKGFEGEGVFSPVTSIVIVSWISFVGCTSVDITRQ